MDPNGFDHDDGMNAFTVEKSTVMRKKGSYVGGAPAYLMAQVHKERDMFNVVVSCSLALPVSQQFQAHSCSLRGTYVTVHLQYQQTPAVLCCAE